MVRQTDKTNTTAIDVEVIQPEDDTAALHDQIVDQLIALPKGVSLGDANYKDDFTKDTNVHTGNFSYKCPDSGTEYEMVLIREILPKACGTKFSAMGNHYLGPASSPNVITDKSCIKAVFAIGKPTDANIRMAIAFDNQVATLDDVIQQDIEELKRKNKDVTIKEWTTHTAGADTSCMPNAILLHSGQLYSVPKSMEQASQGKRAKIAKRPLEKTPAILVDSTERGLQGKGVATSSVPAGISTNDFYDPTILQDYGSEVFRHENASLRQLDFMDVDNELIHPWYSALRRGTLVVARATLHAYNWEGRCVYQLSAQLDGNEKTDACGH